MRQVVVPRYGPPHVLQVREVAAAQPGPGQVRIRVRAAGVNFADLLARMGVYPGAPPLPFVPGYEVCGHVDAVGPGAGPLQEGDPVFALTRFGGYAESVIVPVAKAFRLPATMTLEEGAAFACAFLTAYHVMIVMANLRRDQRVLIHSAAGGVGTAAIQLAKLIGAETFGTASAPKHAALVRLGLDHPIDHAGEDFERVVRRQTGGRGVHLILDPVGGASWRKSYRLLAPTGRLCVLGFSDVSRGRSVYSLPRLLLGLATAPCWRPLRLMEENRGVFGVKMAALWDYDEHLHQEVGALLALSEAGRLRPVVDRTFPLAGAAAAHTYIHEGRNFGKVLLTAA
jgi:NADPH:quinone reductase-like Zn-dependent oxidoreductase